MPDARIAAPRRTAQHRAHARRHLVEIERLDDVIVGAGIEPLDAISHVVARGDDDDRRRIAPPAQLAQHLEAVASGKTEIEQHEIEASVRSASAALRPSLTQSTA